MPKQSFEGTVFGTRVGIYYSAALEGPRWTEKASGTSITYSVLLRASASGGPDEVVDMSKLDDQNQKVRLIFPEPLVSGCKYS